MSSTPIYYEDQSHWSAADFYGLFRYLGRLFQYVGPSSSLTSAEARLDSLSVRERERVRRVAAIQAKRTGGRDEELAGLDLTRMTPDTRYLMKHLLVSMNRYELALERFANLRGLRDVGELGHEIFLDDNPKLADTHLTRVGIYL